MSLSITHSFVSAVPDVGDTSLVRPSNWNASHNINGILPSSQVDPTLSVRVSTGGTVTVSSADQVIILRSTSATPIVLCAVALRNAQPLQVYDWSGTSGDMTFTPNGTETIMGLTTWIVGSGGVPGSGGSLYLIPLSTMSGWAVR